MIEKTQDLALCQALRHKVFVEEQAISVEEEIDGRDGAAIHLLVRAEGRAVGTARLLIEGETGKIGRVAVLREWRGAGLGAALIRGALAELRAMPGVKRAKLGAQSHAIGFYERLGFSAYGPEYLDAGLPHRDMVLDFA
ncbi:GNAT family N-acetyltransferase [Paracoccus aminophilus]|uniref:GCN5-related N-acetyltransferase n=1 Tax=Paracoccus aminophilus JCM 7686 TaxID=1367847 RepID=S5Y8T5_PARAH|nr:GNAT family N-acetyltransferase [Paracoccus aminophilus]AGT07763.1 GCN5-related N-acetyltransferase [Paracoccus aminophilus JCM 7686]